MERLSLSNSRFWLSVTVALGLLGLGAIKTFDDVVMNRATVDNVRIDGNTISTTNTNGNLTLTPNGTGVVNPSALTVTGNAIFSNATATTVPYLNASKVLTSSAVTPTELGYLTGVTSAIQTQINNQATTLFYRSVTTTDSPSNTTDRVLKLSGASFTVTLPTAVGVSGKVFVLIHAGTSLSQIYTLNTTSAQTIGGIASGSYVLYTNGETLEIISDGANWQILSHYAETPWTDNGANSVTATTTNPTKGTTTVDSFRWRRIGSEMEFKIEYRQTSAGTAGSGAYLWAIPSNMAIDTNYIRTTGSSITDYNASILGTGYVSDHTNAQAANTNNADCRAYDSTKLIIIHEGAAGINLIMSAVNAQNFGDNPFSMYITGSVTISGWRP